MLLLKLLLNGQQQSKNALENFQIKETSFDLSYFEKQLYQVSILG